MSSDWKNPAMRKLPRKPRNPLARELRNPLFRKRILRSRKTYRRKGRSRQRHGRPDDPPSARPPGLRAARDTAALGPGPPR